MELAHNPFTPEAWSQKRRVRPVPVEVRGELYKTIDALLDPKYQPQLVAKGGEHLVFMLADEEKPRDIVVKVNFAQTLPIYDARMNGDAAEEERLVSEMRAKMQKMKQDLATLKMYFGAAAVPAQQFMLRDVPATERIVQLIEDDYESIPDDEIVKIPAWISVQRKLELDMDSDRTVSLNGYYQESELQSAPDPETLADYDELHRLLVCGKDEGMTNEEQIRAITDSVPGLETVAAVAEYDEDFKLELGRVAGKMIRYVLETKNILDLAGPKNIVLVKIGGTWKLRMPDALPVWDADIGNLTEAARVLKTGEFLGSNLAQKCYNAINTVRVINALAIIAGIKERLLLPELEDIDPEAWRENLMQAAF